MNLDASKENRLTLQRLLGLNEAISEKVVGSSVLVSINGEHPRLQEFICTILRRTFEIVHCAPQAGFLYSCEILTDPVYKHTQGPYVFLGQGKQDTLLVSIHPSSKKLPENTHPFIYFLIACYASGMVLRKIIGSLPVTVDDEIIIELNKIIKNKEIFANEIHVDEAYLAGAGAIGNAFLYALSTFRVEGELKVVDPDFVSGGNLNRCLLFTDEDINSDKVEVLTGVAQPFFSKLKLIPLPCELANIPNKPEGAWLKKLIVGVDSRRARRNLQGEIPGEVFDASTTGITEVVLHHHKRPLEGACLGCIYFKEKQEESHEIHVAEALGVSLSQVRQQFIDEAAAEMILKKYPIDRNSVIGLPYDTLFKQLCGEGKLMTSENNQVLAPLAFVSALAGAFLALMFVEQHIASSDYNYWRISPWANLNFRLQQKLGTHQECESCNSETYTKVAKSLWG